MLTCFVIQPFDGGKFDKRFEDVFAPAITDAGLDPYRVDQDATVVVPIESIERGIRDSAICLADITTDNPNVWYELGYAMALRKPVVMVCSVERTSQKYPFDIQHRTIIAYSNESVQDFIHLKEKITSRMEALLENNAVLEQLSDFEQVAPKEGLSNEELQVLAALASETSVPDSSLSIYELRNAVTRIHLTGIGFSLGFRRLNLKGIIEITEEVDDFGNPFECAKITSRGWDWIDQNETLFILHKKPKQESWSSLEDSDIPY